MSETNKNYEDIDAVIDVINNHQTTVTPMGRPANPKTDDIDDVDAIFSVMEQAEKAQESSIPEKPKRTVIDPLTGKEEDIDTILTVFSKNNQVIKPETLNKDEIESMITSINFTAHSSIGNHGMVDVDSEIDIQNLESEDIIETFNNKIRRWSIALCLAVSIFSSIILAEVISPVFNPIEDTYNSINRIIHSIQDRRNRTEGIRNGTNILISNYRQNMLYKNLSYQDPQRTNPFVIKNNSVQDYESLNASNLADVYIYRKIFVEHGQQEEFQKFIKSINYFDVEGNYCNYLDFEQYLRINGYPDIETFENYAQNEIYELYKNGEINLQGLNVHIPTRGGI